ncbi:MAG: DNA-binding NarL/FixJ family response regulator [Paraglaciecola sp.]|jgi:DNA-binding NarL/FixJ family response regulator
MTINVMLVDDQTLVREGIKSLLNLAPNISIVAEANDGAKVLEVIAKQSPEAPIEVILMDIRMPTLSGINAVIALQNANITIPVIMLTTFDDHALVIEAIQAGAKGYLLKDVSLETLVEGIQAVHCGQTLIQPAITQRIIEGLRGLNSNSGVGFDSAAQPQTLSEKELEILRLMASGCSNKEISQVMFKSEGTVKNQVSNVLAKLGVRDRTRAVLKAIESGLL